MIRWHRLARRDAEEAALFYEDRVDGLGTEFLNVLDTAIAAINSAPRRWPVAQLHTSEFSIRRYSLKKFPHSIFYLATETDIRVIAVAHQKRRPGFWLERMD